MIDKNRDNISENEKISESQGTSAESLDQNQKDTELTTENSVLSEKTEKSTQDLENTSDENSSPVNVEDEKEEFLSPDNIFSEYDSHSQGTVVSEISSDTSDNEENEDYDAALAAEEDIDTADTSIDISEEKTDGMQYTIIHMPTKPTGATENKDDSESAKKAYNPEKPRAIDKVFEFVELFVFTLVAVMLISSFLFRHSIVDGPSMENTLYHGEHLIISNLFYTPKQGDIVVCDDHTTALKKPIVKRVIATEGQRVTITEDGTVTVDGIPLPEEYVYLTNEDYIYEPYDDVVPEGKIFVMGDHRDNSSDSRDVLVGPIDVRSVLGKVILRIYPFDRFGTVD